MNIKIDVSCPLWLRTALNLLQSRLASVEQKANAYQRQIEQQRKTIANPPIAPIVGNYFAVSADFSFDPATKGIWQLVDLTGNHNGTLPYLEPGDIFPIMNVGSGTLTVKDSTGTTVATLNNGETTHAVGGASNAITTPVAVIGGASVL